MFSRHIAIDEELQFNIISLVVRQNAGKKRFEKLLYYIKICSLGKLPKF